MNGCLQFERRACSIEKCWNSIIQVCIATISGAVVERPSKEVSKKQNHSLRGHSIVFSLVRGCSRVHSAVLSDWRDPLDPEAELELIYLQLRFGVEVAEKKCSDAEPAVRDVVQVVRDLEGEHRKQKARSGGSIAVENAYGL